jgi:hypothetical protein
VTTALAYVSAYYTLNSTLSLAGGPAIYDCFTPSSPIQLSAQLTLLYGSSPLTLPISIAYDKCGTRFPTRLWYGTSTYAGSWDMGGDLAVSGMVLTLSGGHVTPISNSTSSSYLNATTMTVTGSTSFEGSSVSIWNTVTGPASDAVQLDSSHPMFQLLV